MQGVGGSQGLENYKLIVPKQKLENWFSKEIINIWETKVIQKHD